MRVNQNRWGRFDNLIPLRPSLSGVQLAGWTPDAPVAHGLGCRLLADQRVPVDGSVSLAVDVYVPRASGRYPAVVSFAAYSKDLAPAGVPTGTNEIGSPPVFTDRGYARVVAARRGMGRSEGNPGVFFGDQDVDDIEKVIAWAAQQPWCNGDVVMFGTSYYAMTQVQTAVRCPPALKAFFCNEMCTDYFRHITAFGGVPALFFANLWMGANFTEKMVNLHVPPVVRALGSQVLNSPLKPVWERQIRKRMTGILAGFGKNTPVIGAREQYVNWIFDGKTRELNSIPPGPYAELEKIAIPFVVVQNLGYFNLHQFGCYDLFENAGTAPNRKWMILGPAEYELPVYAWQLEALAFFDHILHDADNGYADQPPVRYWLEGADEFVSADSFPIRKSKPVRFHLSSGGEDGSTHRLAAGDAATTGSNSWVAIPLGAPVIGGLNDITNQTLTYEKVMTEIVELSGPVAAHLSFSCNEIDSHVVASLGRVDTNGAYHLLSLGTISPARRRLDPSRTTACEIAINTGEPQPLTPGEPVALSFSLTPQPTRLQPGEKLRFNVASRTDYSAATSATDTSNSTSKSPHTSPATRSTTAPTPTSNSTKSDRADQPLNRA